MILSKTQTRLLDTLYENRSEDFAALVARAGVDRRTAFIGANLSQVDFGQSDLSFFNFSQADLSNADMTHATGKDRLVLTDANLNGVKGLRIQDHRLPDDPDMVRIPAGGFTMGATAREHRREKVPKEYADWEGSQRTITIPSPFWLARAPVTRGQFAAFVRAKNHHIPKGAYVLTQEADGSLRYKENPDANWENPGFPQTDNDPVVCVNFDDAIAYVAWLSDTKGTAYRLPSEAEWEYAARAGTTNARYWGDDRTRATRFANVADESLRKAFAAGPDPERWFPGDDSYPFTSPVASFPPNPFGLYDMLGNVWEWCADAWADTLKDHPANGSPNTTGDSSRRALRGGSWDINPGSVRAAARVRSLTGYRGTNTGFRVART